MKIFVHITILRVLKPPLLGVFSARGQMAHTKRVQGLQVVYKEGIGERGSHTCMGPIQPGVKW